MNHWTTPELLRLSLNLTTLGIPLLALLALRRRGLTFKRFLAWGMVTLFLPLIGPFVALLWARPNRKRLLDERTAHVLAQRRTDRGLKRRQRHESTPPTNAGAYPGRRS